jgi:C-terminal processing protease CtpA/Prc
VGLKLGEITEGSGRRAVATFPGSSAEAAGIKIGDVVYSLDGLPASGLNEKQISKAMRGPVGSTMDLVVAHERSALGVRHLSIWSFVLKHNRSGVTACEVNSGLIQ